MSSSLFNFPNKYSYIDIYVFIPLIFHINIMLFLNIKIFWLSCLATAFFRMIVVFKNSAFLSKRSDDIQYFLIFKNSIFP